MIVSIFLPDSKQFDQQNPTYKSKEKIKVQIYRAESLDFKF